MPDLNDIFDEEQDKGRIPIEIEIDSLTECLKNRRTGEIVQTTYKELTKPIKKEAYKGWKFDWSKTQKNGYHIFELYVSGIPDVKGRISAKIDGGVADLDIIETAPHNYGHNGVYEGVGGHLIAIACKYSLENGCDGFVSFLSKSDLINYYHEKFGAQLSMGRRMYIDEKAAKVLINKYFKEDK